MTSLLHLWLPILVSAVAVFIASSVMHMVVKWHNSDYGKLPNEDEVAEAIRRGQAAPGQYVLPHCLDMGDMKTPESQKKYTDGPVGLIVLQQPGLPNMGKALLGWFVFLGVVSFLVAYVVSRTLGAAPQPLHIFRVTGTVAFLTYAGSAAQASIWMGKPWRITFKDLADGLIYGLVTGGVFSLLWPK